MYTIYRCIITFLYNFAVGIQCELSCVSMSMSVSRSFDIKIDISEIYRKHLTFAQCRYMSITEQNNGYKQIIFMQPIVE